MALVRRPEWPPLPNPPDPDPATLHEFEELAASDLGTFDSAADALGVGLAETYAQLPASEAATDQLGVDLAAGAVELDAMRRQAEADTLAPELAAAGDQDAAIYQTGVELATRTGEPPPEPPPTESGGTIIVRTVT
jgi:hypothetical protein